MAPCFQLPAYFKLNYRICEPVRTSYRLQATGLLRIQFDDQLLVDRQVDVFPLRQRQHLAAQAVLIGRQPRRRRLMARELPRTFHHRQLLAIGTNLNFVAHAHLERGDVHLPPVHFNVSVANQLARLAPRTGKPETEGHVVQTPLELLQQQLAGDARGARCLLVIGAELPFQGKVDTACFLFFAQLQAVAYDLCLAITAVLARGKIALLDGALVGKTLRALQEQLHAFSPAEPADRSRITCQCILLNSEADRFTSEDFVPVLISVQRTAFSVQRSENARHA